ncbi:MAG TPA: HAD-IA family hydrolase [Thermoanaerobaculia bacterium]|nr:HAD-IA family hydrolase [Thermoanaerobaculia bacterium]
MSSPFEVVTFDCYGTLIDWERGIREAFRRAAAEDGIEIDEERLLETYAAVERVVEQERYRRYRDVLWETGARVAHAVGWPLERQRAGFLADSLPFWRPFPDTNGALERLRDAGLTLGILSNVDDDLLWATRRHLTVEFDLVVTAQQVSSYKPERAHFDAARKQVGGRHWLHAAQSNYHDIVPANALGIPTAWINRHGGKALPGGEPSMEYRELDGLAAALAAS